MLSHTIWFFSSVLAAVESSALIVYSLWDLCVTIPHLSKKRPGHQCATTIIMHLYSNWAGEVNALNIENDFIWLWSMWLILINQCHLLKLDF